MVWLWQLVTSVYDFEIQFVYDFEIQFEILHNYSFTEEHVNIISSLHAGGSGKF